MNAVMTEEKAQKSYADYVSEWQRIDTSAGWAKGDLLVEMTADARYGDGKMADLAKDTGTSKSTLFEYRKVALTFPEKSRRPDISFSVHSLLAAMDAADRDAILPRLAAHVSYRQAKKDITAYKAKKVRTEKARITVAKDEIISAVTKAEADGMTREDIVSALKAKGYLADMNRPEMNTLQAGFIAAVDDAAIRKVGDRYYLPGKEPGPAVIPGPEKVKLTPATVQEKLAEKQKAREQEAPDDGREYQTGARHLPSIHVSDQGDARIIRAAGHEITFSRDHWAEFITAEYALLGTGDAEKELGSRAEHPSAK